MLTWASPRMTAAGGVGTSPIGSGGVSANSEESPSQQRWGRGVSGPKKENICYARGEPCGPLAPPWLPGLPTPGGLTPHTLPYPALPEDRAS